MAVFNVSFLNPSMRKSSSGPNTSILTDKLSILQNELGKDGFLSSGDYDILIDTARKTQPLLNQNQRSAYDVKISQFERQKEIVNLSKTEDIPRMDRAIKSEGADDMMYDGNNPVQFLWDKRLSIEAKLNDLNESMQNRQRAGNDITEYANEYNTTLQQYRDTVEAFNVAAGRASGTDTETNPIKGYVAYVTTNNNGEIVNVDYSKYGYKPGYIETNATIDGFLVYAKPNDNNYFVLGNTKFAPVDLLRRDPQNPNILIPTKLVANAENKNGYSVGKAGYVNLNGRDLTMQGSIPKNSWAKGVDGTVYKRRDDGGYTKYININRSMPDMPPEDRMITLPDYYERAIMNKADDTVDLSAPITPNNGFDRSPIETQLSDQAKAQSPTSSIQNMSLIQRNAPTTASPAIPALKKTSKKPEEISSINTGNVIQRTIKSGADYLKRLFT